MIYFFYGADSFLIRQKVNKEIERYRAKHKSGLNFSRFDLTQEQTWGNFKIFIESYSMFAEKKLAILENLIDASPITQENFLAYLKASDLPKDQERFVIVAQALRLNDDKKKIERYILKDAVKEIFKKLTNQGVASQEFNLLTGAKLEFWIKNEIETGGGKVDDLAVKKIVASVGPDLWQLKNEIDKLIGFKNGQAIGESDVDKLVKAKIDSDIFKTIDALAARNEAAAFKFLYRNLAEGESEISLLGMLAYQFRNLLLVKSQLEERQPYFGLEKKLKMHPFVLRKTLEQSKNFSLVALKKIYERLMEIDFGIKSGQFEASAALDLIVKEVTA